MEVELRCRKSARRCGAKHISKSKVLKTDGLGVEISKKCAPLWREAHFQVKMYKAHHAWTTFLEVGMSKKCMPLWRKAHVEVNSAKKLTGSEHFWAFRCRFCVAGAGDCAPCQK